MPGQQFSSEGDSIVDSDFHGCRHRAASPLCPVAHRELPCCRVSGLVLHGHKGAVGDLSCMSIFSACFGLLTSVQLAATTWSGQIWISCWILPHFDVRTISVAWKLKKLSNIFWQKIFFLLNPLSKGVAPLCNVVQYSDNTFTSALSLFKVPIHLSIIGVSTCCLWLLFNIV